MQTKIKSYLPSLAYMFIGMLAFFILSKLSFPPMFRYILGTAASVFLFYLSKPFLRYENIALSVVHLIPNKGTAKRLSVGLIIGAIITGAMLFMLFTLTDLGIEPNNSQSLLSFLLASTVIIPLALMEELLFRGYPFFRLSQLINIRWVLLITASLFALYHYNGTSSISSLFLGPGIWGITFGVAAYLSKSIAVPLGIHISANAIQALYGLKTNFTSMWTVTKSLEPSTNSLDAEFLGLTMQLALLVISIIVFEVFKRKREKLSGDITS